MNHQDEILTKVRKILTKAEDPAATPHEAETYTAKAAELMAAYGIDRALLAAASPDSDVVGDKVVLLDAPYALDKAGLLNAVALSLRCRAVQRVRREAGGKQISMHLFGFDSDLFRVEVLYTSLLVQASTALNRTSAPPYESLAAYRRSWLAGFTAAVSQRLAEAETRAEAQAEARSTDTPAGPTRSVSLVLADRSALVGRAVEAEYPHLVRGQARHLSGSGGQSGWRAGQRADLGGTRVRAPGRATLAG